jgi:alpha-ketoglutarate-dependent taurine dioxygenase
MTTNSHSIKVVPLAGKSFGAVVSGIKLSELDDDSLARLYQEWLKYALLIFPEQYLTDAQQRDAASKFGPLVEGLEAAEISNLLPNGEVRAAPDDDMMKIIRGNMQWHQDNTYMPVQSKGALFSAKTVPSKGGETGFADMRAAWDALDPETQERLAPRSALHSLVHSQKTLGEDVKSNNSEYIGYGLDVTTIPRRSLVKVHPETHRKTLAIGRHAFGVSGMTEEESARLVNDLIEFATSDQERTYHHTWSEGDAVLWANRCLMHRACSWDFSQPRVMLHSRIAGDPKTEAAEAL